MRNRWKGVDRQRRRSASLLAGCSDPGAGGGATAAGPATWPEPTARLDGVELTIWAAQNSTTVAEKVVADFEAATGATVEIVTIPDPYEQGVQTKVATGDKPDLAFWQPTASMLTALDARNEPAAARRRALARRGRTRRCATSPACSTAPATPR